MRLDPFRPFLGFGDFSDIYLEETQNLSLHWEDGKIESVARSEDSGAGLRILKGLETRFAHLNLAHPLEGRLTDKEKESLTRLHRGLTQGLGRLDPPAFKEISVRPHAIRRPPQNHDLKEKMEVLRAAYEAAKMGAQVRQVEINYGEKIKKIAYVNSKGESFVEERTYLVFSLTVTAEKDGDLQNAYDAMGGLTGFELFDGAAAPKLAKAVAERALKKLEAPPAPAGEMPVVIAASAGGTLIHEAVGHSLEADAVLEGTSPAYVGKLGRKVANEKLTVLDDPTIPGKRGSFAVDDEGVLAESSRLIENGVLKDFMYDRHSALREGRTSNGHGRRESYAHPPIPRMSNTMIAPGKDDPAKILKSFRHGLLVTKMGGGQVNTANGDFVFDVEEGFQVNDGKRTMVRGATLLGNGPETLLLIDQVGSDFGEGIGTCGKEGQGVPVSDGIPTIHIKKMIIGGRK